MVILPHHMVIPPHNMVIPPRSVPVIQSDIHVKVGSFDVTYIRTYCTNTSFHNCGVDI